MIDIEIIRGRYYTYLLFSDLYLRGITADSAPQISAIPELAGFIKDPIDFDEAAADHHSLFSLDIFPYESIFRDPAGLLGGETTNQVQDLYQRFGYYLHKDGDHIGHELHFLAYLCTIDIEEYNQGGLIEENSKRSEQNQFFQDHLLCWLPAFAASLEHSGSEFYKELGRLTMSVIDDHFTSLPSTPRSEGNIETIAPPNLQKTHDASLRQIVDFLNTPPFSGIYLGREQIKRLSRRHHLPIGFGNRQQMLLNLFRASGQYESSRLLFQDLILIADNFIKVYQQQKSLYPSFTEWIEPWETKAANTREYLSNLWEQVPS